VALYISRRLEHYTAQHPNEVLRVVATIAGEEDEVLFFRGFSSSLMRPTAADPDVLVLPDDSTILSVDRLHGPYNPQSPQYIQKGLSWAEMEQHLVQAEIEL
jgi:hypothetical protein